MLGDDMGHSFRVLAGSRDVLYSRERGENGNKGRTVGQL